MDHRAVEDATFIDSTDHPVLQFVGGSISPEMQTPKLRWVKRNLPDSWRRAARWFDLADYLTWRATGSEDRSLCTTVCKWTYLGHERRWDQSYFEQIGLGGSVGRWLRAHRCRVSADRASCSAGSRHAPAGELGLAVGTAVGVSLIDAHAGALGMLGAGGRDGSRSSACAS